MPAECRDQGVPGCPRVRSLRVSPPRVAASCHCRIRYPRSPRGGASLPYVAPPAPGRRIFSFYPCSALGVAPFPRELFSASAKTCPPKRPASQGRAPQTNGDFDREGGLGSAHRSRQFTPRCWSPTYQHHPQGINVTPRTVPEVFSSRTFRSPLRPLDSQRGTARRELWSAGTAIPAPAKPDASPLRTLRLYRYSRRSEGTGGARQERSEGTIAHAALAKRQQAQWPWSHRRWRKQEQGQQRKRERCR